MQANTSKAARKVYLGLSGGVDSSVSALLLKEAGYDVTGVFIEVWQPDFMPCSQEEDRQDAKRVAAQLGIPFKVLNLKEAYKRDVVDAMLNSYKKGDTPNPDILCNKTVKFGAFYDWARNEGADFVATGHYAQVTKQNNEYFLSRSVDENKDQTYFLWTLTREQLPHILFPVGGMKKEETREKAGQANLVTARKRDSQGICFLGAVDMQQFLLHFITTEKGDVLNEDGECIGEHEGALFYTLGQRHGFLVHASTPETKPLYVVDKDIEKNIIVVASNTRAFAQRHNTKEIALTNFHAINSASIKSKKESMQLFARLRHRQALFSGVLHFGDNGHAVFTPDEQQPSVVKGQSLVFYRETTCIGGALID